MSAIPLNHPVYQQTADAIDAFMTESCSSLAVDLTKRNFHDRLRHMGVMLDAFYETLDTVFGDHIRDDVPAQGLAVSCKPGCSHCCHRDVRASLPEIIAAVAYLNEHVEVRDAFLKRSGSSKSCNFLVNNVCTIYEMRPVECREVHSLDDPSKCVNDFAGRPVMLGSGFAENHKNRTLDAIASVVTSGFGLSALPVGRFDTQVYLLLRRGAAYFDKIKSLSV